MRHKKGTVVVAIAATLTTALAGCGSSASGAKKASDLDLSSLNVSSASQSTMRNLYTAAIKSGHTKVVIYGPNETNYQPLNDAFAKTFPGIKVVGEPYSGATEESRLATEFSSNKHVADIIETTDYLYQAKGDYQAYTPTTTATLDKKFVGPANQLWGASGTLFGFEYNSSKLKAADAPTSWADLADPKWKGQIVAGDPSQPSATSDMLIKLQAAGVVNDAWLHALAANKLAIKSQLELAGTAVAQGEYSILLTTIYNYYAADKAKGAPVTWVYPSDGVMVEPNFYGIVKGAPDLDASKLYMEWLFGRQAQTEYVKLGAYPLMPGTPTGTDLKPINELKVLNVPDPNAMNKLWGSGTAKLKSILGGGSSS